MHFYGIIQLVGIDARCQVTVQWWRKGSTRVVNIDPKHTFTVQKQNMMEKGEKIITLLRSYCEFRAS